MAYNRKDQSAPKTLSPTEAAYLAGFIDGDGCLMLTRRKKAWGDKADHKSFYRPIVDVAQRDIDVLAYLKGLVGAGTIVTINAGKYGGWQIKWDAGVIRWLLPQIEPYLVLKKKQANILIEYVRAQRSGIHGKALTIDQYNYRTELYNRMRQLNQKPKYKVEKRQAPQEDLVDNPQKILKFSSGY